MPEQRWPTTEAGGPKGMVEDYAHACLEGLLVGGGLSGEVFAHAQGNGVSVLVIAFPTPTGQQVPGLTSCDRAILRLLSRVTDPLSALRVHQELDDRDLGIFGEATVKRSLAKLMCLGLVANSRHSPRGYYCPGAPPLFRRPAAECLRRDSEPWQEADMAGFVSLRNHSWCARGACGHRRRGDGSLPGGAPP
jgi:hypothetical protein